MLALYRAGRQADALAAYRDAHRALVEGLGIEPSPGPARAGVGDPAPGGARARRRRASARRSRADTRRWVTCVFSQLTGAERPGADPESLRAVVERFHDAGRAVFASHGGSVVELRNDAVVAVLGIPVAHEDDAQRALRAAAELRAGRALPFGLRARSGACTGEVVAASGPPDAAPVIGEAVAVAERLARSAAGGEIRLAESTWQVVRHAARASPLADGGFLLGELDADAPAIGRRLDQPLIGRERGARAPARHVRARRGAALAGAADRPRRAGHRQVPPRRRAEAIAGERGTVLTGRCPAYGEGITLWPLREVVVQAMGDRSPDELAAALGIPAVAVRRVAAAVGLEDGEPGEDTDWAFLQLVGALARMAPLVLVIDDAHWAEPALLDLLLDLVARLRDAPVLVVWVARPDLLERGGGRVERGTALTLRPLSPAASDSLLAAIAGGRLRPTSSAGSPRRRAATRCSSSSSWPTSASRRAADALPPALQALLAARLDRLDAAERSALALGGDRGRHVQRELGARARRRDHARRVERACERLVERDLLVRDAARGSLRFRHALIRDVAYASLAKSARAGLHERHADWLDELGGELPEADARIGFHLETRLPLRARDRRRRASRACGARRAAARRGGATWPTAVATSPARSGSSTARSRCSATTTPEGARAAPGPRLRAVRVGRVRSGRGARRPRGGGERGARPRRACTPARAIEREHIRLSCHPETFAPERSVAAARRRRARCARSATSWGWRARPT